MTNRLRRERNESAPLLWAALCFAGGVLLARYAWRPPLWWLVATIACPAASAAMLRNRTKGIAHTTALLAFVALGALNFQGRTASDHQPDLFAFDDQKVLIEGTVTRAAALHLPGSA